MFYETVLAKSVRKGQIVVIHGTTVRVTKREKWNSAQVKVHFEDCGHGLPAGYGPQFTETAAYFPLNTALVLVTA